MTDDGGAAFPKEHSHMTHHQRQDGMSIRDYFAIRILEGKLTPGTVVTAAMIDDAYKTATMMVHARQKDYAV